MRKGKTAQGTGKLVAVGNGVEQVPKHIRYGRLIKQLPKRFFLLLIHGHALNGFVNGMARFVGRVNFVVYIVPTQGEFATLRLLQFQKVAQDVFLLYFALVVEHVEKSLLVFVALDVGCGYVLTIGLAQKSKVAYPLPQSELLEIRVRLGNALHVNILYFSRFLINILAGFVRTVGYKRLFAFQRTLIKQHVFYKQVLKVFCEKLCAVCLVVPIELFGTCFQQFGITQFRMKLHLLGYYRLQFALVIFAVDSAHKLSAHLF